MRTDIDNACWRAGCEHIEQQMAQQERCQLVHGQRHLHSIHAFSPPGEGRSRIIDQHMQVRIVLLKVLDELADGLLRRQVC